jgi:hypothetical protein
LGRTPSARARDAFTGFDDRDRVIFLCAALWYGRYAARWLSDRDEEGLVQGGRSYRSMTTNAAYCACRYLRDERRLRCLPYTDCVRDDLPSKGRRRAIYDAWTFDLRYEPMNEYAYDVRNMRCLVGGPFPGVA